MAAHDEIDELLRQAWALRRTQHDEAGRLARKAARLSRTGECATVPYVDGLAAAESIKSFLHLEAGDFAAATRHGERALALLAGRPPCETAADATLTLTWIALHAGSYADALRYGWQALEVAEAAGLPYWESGAHDALGCLYADGHDHDEALARFTLALGIARRHGFADRESTALDNLAAAYDDIGDHERALETALAALELARRDGLVHRQLATLSKAASQLAKLGRADEALPLVEEAFALGYPLPRSIRWLALLEATGRVHLARGALDAAEARLTEALELADELGVAPVQATCHRLLADLREQQGSFREALAELRRAEQISAAISGERIASQLAFLKVAHQIETARRDAEIHRLRAATLQKEMEHERRAVTRLERLASSDALTGLHNRRHVLEIAAREVQRALRTGRPLTVLLLDVDRFKRVNDQHGHAVGDQVLAGIARILRHAARDGDAVARYGGEEFLLLLPDTALAGGTDAAERLRLTIGRTPLETSAGTLAISASIGAAELDDGLREVDHGEVLGSLLDRADQALYKAKRGGRNRVEAFAPAG